MLAARLGTVADRVTTDAGAACPGATTSAAGAAWVATVVHPLLPLVDRWTTYDVAPVTAGQLTWLVAVFSPASTAAGAAGRVSVTATGDGSLAPPASVARTRYV